MELYLIRHGKTFANENHLYCGSTDLPLSENGVEELKTKCYTVPQDVQFVTSGMKRTQQTLRTLFGDIPYTVDTDFREIDFGIFEMKSYEQLKDNPEYQQWLEGDNFVNIPPLGESGRQMTDRVTQAVERYIKQGKNTVIITHGGVIAAVMTHLFPQEDKNIYQWQPKPGCGYIVKNGTFLTME